MCLVLLAGGHTHTTSQQDCQLFHHLAVYIRHQAKQRGLPVLAFLEGEVTAASYVFACAADAIVASDTTRLCLDWSQGGLNTICRRMRPKTVQGEGPDCPILDQAMERRLVDKVGTYMEFLVNNQGVELVVVQGHTHPVFCLVRSCTQSFLSSSNSSGRPVSPFPLPHPAPPPPLVITAKSLMKQLSFVPLAPV